MEAETVVDAMKRFEEGWEDEYQASTPPHMTVYPRGPSQPKTHLFSTDAEP